MANAVQAFVERKRMQFAVLKALGATGSRVFQIALVEVLTAAVFAILLGLAVGALIPWAAAGALREVAERATVHFAERFDAEIRWAQTTVS